jgi:hypothetical protein
MTSTVMTKAQRNATPSEIHAIVSNMTLLMAQFCPTWRCITQFVPEGADVERGTIVRSSLPSENRCALSI